MGNRKKRPAIGQFRNIITKSGSLRRMIGGTPKRGGDVEASLSTRRTARAFSTAFRLTLHNVDYRRKCEAGGSGCQGHSNGQ